MHRQLRSWSGILLVLASSHASFGADWSRFRGPNGSGVSQDQASTPVTWSQTQNIKWKVDLPGPGSSSPIVVGDKVFVTCWTGYALERGTRAGEQSNLKRHLICFDRQTGNVAWDRSVDPYLPEEGYSGMFAENGYATHTPVSDGERVYVFFGKTGVLAFDLNGKQLWQTTVGTGSDSMGWGSASSPILYKNLVIVTASPESKAMYGLDKSTGKEVWKQEADGFSGTWGTPVLIDSDEGRTDLVVGVPYEIWGFNPETGNIRWFCEALNVRSFCSSVVTDGKLIYAMGDQGSGSIAIKPGGKDDVTKSHVVWIGKDNNRIGSPVIADGKIYFVNNRVLSCSDTKTGTRIFQGRLGTGSSAEVQDDAGQDSPRDRGARGGRGTGGRNGGGGQDYSSPVIADGKIYFVTRSGDMHVVKVADTFEPLATNRVTDEAEDFSATPAIKDGALFIRSSKRLYCIAETPASSTPEKPRRD
ncbi:outer membrane protein assembly factor BamB family protein [Schlesneria paludicola]|uniref:outer membrane protein assembly factor BamB family protein n=1 Tax=Schlesneria paludicola TaxID=360056 RepID=UPI0012FB0CCF|nr:PQQ-binding-like beta-propeller repeat protein [Schlesneria paludicola]